jgi:tRNA A-37 threonylcarbamoyl transferase component Bud32
LPSQRFEISSGDRDWVAKMGWQTVNDILAIDGDELAALSRTSDVVRVPVDASCSGPNVVFVKRYHYPQVAQRIKQMFRGTLFGPSRARREFEFLSEMRRRTVTTVRPIAYGEAFHLGFVRSCVLITEGLDNARSLDLFAHHARSDPTRWPTTRDSLIRQVGRSIRQMHHAGVRHGGLFWRNIMVSPSDAGAYDITLLDPDINGRLRPSPVPPPDAIADLSEVVASGIAFGLRSGLAKLLKTYFQVTTLTREQRQFASQVVDRAQAYVQSERHRIAVARAIDWAGRRSESQSHQPARPPTYSSIDDFFDALSDPSSPVPSNTESPVAIQFLFSKDAAEQKSNHRSVHHCDRHTVVLDNSRATVSTTHPTKPHLVIRSDLATWLAIVTGASGASARLRSGHLQLDGDVTALVKLMNHIDRVESVRMAVIPNAGIQETQGNSPRDP